MSTPVIDVLIPARGGSVGLPGKNGRILVDRPLLSHSVACAQLIEGVRTILLSTDDETLAALGRSAGATVPELRPSFLAEHETPMADVIRYAVALLDRQGLPRADVLCLLDPTSPLRQPEQIARAGHVVHSRPDIDGAISISMPAFNPLWVGVQVDASGQIHRHPLIASAFTRRQEVPDYWRINGSFYLWKPDFAERITPDWLDQGRFIGIEMPELLSHSIDTLDDFRLVEALLTARAVQPPWLSAETV